MELIGFPKGVDNSGVNFLSPENSFQSIEDGYVYRQELKSRKGFNVFSTGPLSDGTRVMGIFEHVLPNSTTQLLAISKSFLYKFNDITNTFDQVPMAGAAPVGGFAISSNDAYVSGTTYPFPDGTQRFVFTGLGMSDIYMYNGTDVKSFTNAADNPNYQAPAAGALTKSKYIAWFGERLNLFAPVIAGQPNPQMTLYSGIRNAAGNGDKFNVSGAGDLSADTGDFITGMKIAGDYIMLMFSRSAWTLNKTRDAFNPYFIRKVPGVLGCDADFSSVFYYYYTMSVGKTGILKCDGRELVREDNLIPFYTADQYDQTNFNLTYGGFERILAQFLFSFRSANSNLTAITQDKVQAFNYEFKTWSTYNMRFSVFGQTDLGINLSMSQIDETQNPSWLMMDTTEEIWNQIGIGESRQKTLAGDNTGFIYQLNQDYDDYFVTITAITQASSAVITHSGSAFEIGDVVYFDDVNGMDEINGQYATVLAATPTTMTVNIDTTLYTAYTSGGNVSKTISFSATTIPINPYRSEGRRVYISHVEFLLNTNGGNLEIDMFSDEETSTFKPTVLLQPSSSTKAREWITAIVDQESNFITFRMRQQNSTSPIVISSMRIHLQSGGVLTA